MSARIFDSGYGNTIKTTLLLLAMLLWHHQALAAVTAQVDRYDISMNETINLSIEVSGSDSGDPDTAPLQQDFEILSRSRSSSYSLINTSISKQSTWMLILRPRHAGTLHIPALNVGGKHTRSIIIHVRKTAVRQSTAGQPTGKVWINMTVKPATVRVQQQAVLTLRIYQSIRLHQAQLSEPKSDHAIIERLGKDKNYQVSRNKQTWAVTERRYAIFPQQHGLLHIAPVQLDGTVMTKSSGFASAFPGFSSQFSQSGQPIRVRSNATQLSVSAIPSGWNSHEWLPAKQVRIQEDWPAGEIRVGDPITRTLTLKADGLSASQLPRITTLLPDGLKGYPDQPVLRDDRQADGIHGSRQQKLAIIPIRADVYTLPEIDIAWWNTQTEKKETATLPARTFKVTAVPGASTSSNSPVPQISGKQPAPPKSVAKKMVNPMPEGRASLWKWLALFFLSGWLLTILWSWHRLHSRQQTHGPARPTPMDTTAARKNIAKACKQHDAKACEQALLHIARLQWPDENVNNLAAFASCCHGQLAQEIKALDCYLYAKKEGAQWQGDKLLQAFEQADLSPVEKTIPQERQALPSLYPD
jgi:hypothetical protein